MEAVYCAHCGRFPSDTPTKCITGPDELHSFTKPGLGTMSVYCRACGVPAGKETKCVTKDGLHDFVEFH